MVSQWQVIELKKIDRDTRPLQKAWFPYDHWQSFTNAGIAIKLVSVRSDHMNQIFFFASRDHQRSQRLSKIAGIESESISAIVAIVNDRQRSQRFMENTSAAIAAIATIIRKSKDGDCKYRKDRSDRACLAILTFPATVGK